MRLNLNKFLYSVSYALDLAESQIIDVSQYHSKRVAFIALQVAEVLHMKEEEKFDLYAYSLMHDNGLLEAYSHSKVTDKKNRIDDSLKKHCKIGEDNIKEFPFLTNHENIILYHHERYDGKGFYGLKGEDIPLMSQIIYFANMIDEMFDLSKVTLSTKEQIDAYVLKNENKLFSPKIVYAFRSLSRSFAFWGSLEYFYVVNNPSKLLKDFEVDISLNQFYNIIQVFTKIIDSKSKFTAHYTKEISSKAEVLINQLGFEEDHKKKMIIAANLHDIGKLATPVEILDKEGTLDENEVFEMKKHAFFTFTLLDGLEFCDDILKWASFHHEKPDGSGYPFGLSSDDLSLEARFVACLDFYQALTEDRAYRKAIGHDKAIEIMKESLTDYYVDFYIIDLIDSTFKDKTKS